MPCIQTLGHMGQVLQWQQYAYLRDNTEVLLAESETTYEFIEKMIQTASRPFRSKRIHIGMDEVFFFREAKTIESRKINIVGCLGSWCWRRSVSSIIWI